MEDRKINQHFIERLKKRYHVPCNSCVYEYLKAIARRKSKFAKRRKGIPTVRMYITPDFDKIRKMTRGAFKARSNVIYIVYDIKKDELITALPTIHEGIRYSKFGERQ